MKEAKRVLVIVAHPDDETIWMGGTLIKNKDWKVEIISLCRKNDSDRSIKFKKVCKVLNAKCYSFDIEDEELKNIKTKEIIEKIKKISKNNKYDYIFTHGKNGEYGHKRHIEVNKAVREMINNKQLKAKKVFLFSYRKKNNFCIPNKNAHKIINLNQDVLSMKRHLIKEIYCYTKDSFESKFVNKTKRESFDILKK